MTRLVAIKAKSLFKLTFLSGVAILSLCSVVRFKGRIEFHGLRLVGPSLALVSSLMSLSSLFLELPLVVAIVYFLR